MCSAQVFFFFKQKTAYEISACLVGSEMCIRDRDTWFKMNGREVWSPTNSIHSKVGLPSNTNRISFELPSLITEKKILMRKRTLKAFEKPKDCIDEYLIPKNRGRLARDCSPIAPPEIPNTIRERKGTMFIWEFWSDRLYMNIDRRSKLNEMRSELTAIKIRRPKVDVSQSLENTFVGKKKAVLNELSSKYIPTPNTSFIIPEEEGPDKVLEKPSSDNVEKESHVEKASKPTTPKRNASLPAIQSRYSSFVSQLIHQCREEVARSQQNTPRMKKKQILLSVQREQLEGVFEIKHKTNFTFDKA
eukprot:TRINITY_DN9626_c0_g3_i1.p1 TRINITY_DN9626_c0_g3~~TRINITY_DN9626_c0_g3_i1.p1  ORF type:complete len:303 (+),score=61.68 TRINITY_DN9626_c0_g3_i1:66-974(+)